MSASEDSNTPANATEQPALDRRGRFGSMMKARGHSIVNLVLEVDDAGGKGMQTTPKGKAGSGSPSTPVATSDSAGILTPQPRRPPNFFTNPG
jgi:hypothetical protein